MTFNFRPAKRENVALLIGLAAPSGGGKTYTAMRLATGIAGGKRFAVIDTDNGRASHYADQFDFDVVELRPPYTPERYKEAIEAADEAGYPVIVVDSFSHEHAGDGGILDMQEAEYKRLGGYDGVKMLSWAKPKAEHKRLMSSVLQRKAHLIFCLRAEAKIDIVKDDKGKAVVVPKESLTSREGWIPICEKTVPFEFTVSFLMTPDHPGVGRPIKLQEQHRVMFPEGAKIDEECGKRISEWAHGATPEPVVDPVLQKLRDASLLGSVHLHEAWEKIGKSERMRLGADHLESLKQAAIKADEAAA
jgi:hypothetical protein